MARTSQLQWEPSRGKWKVVYKGRKYRFDGGTGKSDREARKRAEAEWKRIRAEVDQAAEKQRPHQVDYEYEIERWTAALTWSMEHGEEKMADEARTKLAKLSRQFELKVPPPIEWEDRFMPSPKPLDEYNRRMAPVYIANGLIPMVTVESGVSAEKLEWEERLKWQARRLEKRDGTEESLGSNVDRFLQEKRTEVSAGQLSAGRVDTIRLHLDLFTDFMGKASLVASIDEQVLAGFRSRLLERIATEQFSDYYARDALATAKLFIRWAASNTPHLEHLPRNIDDRRLNISVTPRKAQTLSKDQVRQLLAKANARTQLYLLLGLNCAMTQQDISDLHPAEVDWDTGVITRKRSKTSDCENVPEVSYPLWGETFRLLKQERSTSAVHVLLTRDSKPLKTEALDGDAKLKKTDAIRLAIRRLAADAKIDFTMKVLKKTSASLLRNHRDYRGLESLFLDHAPSSMSDRHYTTIPQQLLNEAIRWLGGELGIPTNE